MTDIAIDENLLPRPPRRTQPVKVLDKTGNQIASIDTGYDWREFDRYLQKLSLMLGVIANSKSYNVPEELKNLQVLSTLQDSPSDISATIEK